MVDQPDAEGSGVGPRVSLDLVVVYTDRLAACVEFYRDLGLVLRREQHGSGPVHHSCVLDGGLVLELYPASARRATTVARLALTVTTTEGRGGLPPGTHTRTDPDGRVVVVRVVGHGGPTA